MSEQLAARERCEAIIEDALHVKARHGHGVGATPEEVFDAILAVMREPGPAMVEASERWNGFEMKWRAVFKAISEGRA